MKRRSIIWSQDAQRDLDQIQDYISDAGDPVNALSFIARIAAFGDSLEYAAERGKQRNDMRPGLRIVGFEKRVTLAFSVDIQTVTILRIFYGGADWENAL